MIVVVDDSVDIDQFHRALRTHGFILRTKPGGIFELIQKTKPVCEQCEKPAVVRDGNQILCGDHYRAI